MIRQRNGEIQVCGHDVDIIFTASVFIVDYSIEMV